MANDPRTAPVIVMQGSKHMPYVVEIATGKYSFHTEAQAVAFLQGYHAQDVELERARDLACRLLMQSQGVELASDRDMELIQPFLEQGRHIVIEGSGGG